MSSASTLDTPVRQSVPAAASVQPALRGVPGATLEAAFAACRSVTRARARNFYYGLRLTPEPRRSAIFAIYAWMRAADDVVDDAPAGAAARDLQRFRATTQRALAGDAAALAPLDPFWTAFAATVASYPLNQGIFQDVLDGLEEDLAHAGYADDAELSRYCYRVASTAGLACVAIWGLRAGADPGVVHELAVRRGQAFQRTNILRDFAEDFDSDPSRVYLPRDAFARHQLTPEEVRSWRRPAACRAFIVEQTARAREEYDASSGLEGMIDPECAPTLWAMTRIYSSLLAVIEHDPERIVATRRIRVPAPRKAMIALRAVWRSRRSGW